ncbi:MAG: cache domain-containing protein [Methanobacteriota archaeon]
MNNVNRLLHISYVFVIILFLMSNCSATAQNSEISFTGQVVWKDIEGGFFGIITLDGTEYLPLNLPKNYNVDGVTVDIIGTITPDVMTMQMWGVPLEIQTIKPVNGENPFIQSWYAPGGNQTFYENETMAEHLIMASSGLQNGLDAIDGKVSSIAKNLTLNGIEGENFKDILHQGLDIPGVYEITCMDKTGRITAIVPENYERFVGTNVSDQDLNSRLLSYPAPGMSGYFRTIEGKDAVIVSYPVFSADKKLAGSVSALFDPDNVTEIYSLPSLNGTNYDLMVAQPDGKILYDGRPDMDGQDTWNDSMFTEFPDHLSWAAHYQNAKAGIDQYSYYRSNSEDIAKTDVIWTTVALHGTPWRIFILNR